MRGAILIGSRMLATVDAACQPRQAAPAPATVSLARLTVSDFRCYRYLRVETDGRPVVLAGPNGAGKTNLLEAISFLVPGRGLRGARLAEVARRDRGGAPGARAWAVAGRVATPQGPVEIGTGREAAGGHDKRVVHIDGEPVKSQAALAEVLNALWLTPQMDRLFTDGAAARRRFLDRLVFGFDPAHAGRVAAYEHALRERARLLRLGGGDRAWLAALEEILATKGVAVAAARRQLAARLGAACGRASGPFPGAALEVRGAVDDWLAAGPALAAEDRLRERLAASRGTDAETGGAAVGPHRSDLAVRHLGNGLPAEECSTGEQKAILISIVLAVARRQAAERGSAPLLLLDEVAAHLDDRGRASLLAEVAGLDAQAWLTGTDARLFAALADRAQLFRVEAAEVRPQRWGEG